MENYINCSCKEMEGGILILQDVSMPEGTLTALFLGPSGTCAVADSNADPKAVYSALRSLLGPTGLNLYLGHSNRYVPHRDTTIPLAGGPAEFEKELRACILHGPAENSPEKLSLLREKILLVDARSRGHFHDESGILHILRGGRFQPVSDLDPEQQYWITLFGGFLGLHKLYMRKFLTAGLYFITCGLFLLGWLLDILQLTLGLQRDRSKALILPPSNRKRKLLFLIPALILGGVVFFFYLRFMANLLDFGTSPALTDIILEGILNRIISNSGA